MSLPTTNMIPERVTTEVQCITPDALIIMDNRMVNLANTLSKSDIIPQTFQNKPANILIALDLSVRMNISPLSVMQALYVIHGKPAWESKYVIALINSSNLFASELQFETSGSAEKCDLKCRAFATSRKTGNVLYGPYVTWTMAKAEGWLSKNGSKWASMPELMVMYRAAAFFSRLYCPQVTYGLMTVEEIKDMGEQELPKNTAAELSNRLEKVKTLANEVLEEIKPLATETTEEEAPFELTPPVEESRIQGLLDMIYAAQDIKGLDTAWAEVQDEAAKLDPAITEEESMELMAARDTKKKELAKAKKV